MIQKSKKMTIENKETWEGYLNKLKETYQNEMSNTEEHMLKIIGTQFNSKNYQRNHHHWQTDQRRNRPR